MIVFVHGVPETAAIWDGVRARIDSDSVALALPGFGNPRPAGFGATKDDYLDWLLGELDRIEGPIDLVGHDWGAILACRVAHAHGDRLRSYAIDCANVSHPAYEWHAFAKVWQAPGEGEAFFESQAATSIDDRAAGLALLGVPIDGAREMAAAGDAEMGSCILDLYRSALPNPHHHWGPLAPSPAAGLVLHVADDPFGDGLLAGEVAASLGAQVTVLDGPGHFWPYEAPEAGAAALRDFWARLGGA